MEEAMILVEGRLLELMSDFNTKEAKPRTYTTALDDVVMTTAAEYVTKATSGFLPSGVPAHKCLKAMTATARALREATNPEAMKLALICAVTLVDELAWEAYDLNNKRLRPGFVVLRGDKDATGPPALYNRKLAEIYNSGGEIFLALRGQSPVLENLAAAIPKLSMCASVTHAPPYSYSDVEVAEALLAAQAMLNFAKAELRV